MSFSSSFDLAALDGDNGFVVDDFGQYESLGRGVSSAGDINGDGIDDVIIGGGLGEAYIIFGSRDGFPLSFNISTLNGTNGFVIYSYDGLAGPSVSGGGDMNGDGIDDLVFGAPFANVNGMFNAKGKSYVVFGSRTGFNATLDLATLNGSNGFSIDGIDPEDAAGRSVSIAGDINGDGIDDLLIGAYKADPNGTSNAGESYVVFGSNTGFNASVSLSTLNGRNGFVINGINEDDFSGRSVSGAGDINNDGFDDLIIGAPLADPNGNSSGASYVVFGATNFNASINLSALNGNNGFVIASTNFLDSVGDAVSSAGDINGDGIDDLIIGSTAGSPNDQFFAGASYVIFGSTNDFGPSFDISSLNGVNGFAINGTEPDEGVGHAVSSAGDINGDGLDDLIIGAYSRGILTDVTEGKSYVVFGSNEGFGDTLNLSALNGYNGFTIEGDVGSLYDEFVSSAGDINADGVDDLIIGAYSYDSSTEIREGKSYVIFGEALFALNKTVASVSETGTTDTVTIVLTAQPTSNVVLRITSSDASEVTATPANLTFTTANWNQPQTVTLTGIDDAIADFDQVTNVVVSVVDASSDDTFDTAIDRVITVTTTDNDVAGFTLNKTSASVSETGTTDTVTVVLDTQPTSEVVLSVTNSDRGEVTATPANLSFTAANWNQPQTITLTGVDDPVIDFDQLSNITVSVVDASSDDVFDAAVDQIIGVTTTDNDVAGFTLDQTEATVSETGTTDELDVVLNVQPDSEVVLSVSSSDTGEVTVDSNTLTFTTENWNQIQTITLTGVDDTEMDFDQLSNVTVSVIDASSDDAFDAVGDQVITVTTLDEEPMGSPQPEIDFDKGRQGDRFRGGRKADKFKGTRHNDVMQGKNGNDKLKGDKGNDQLDGDKGNDKLLGGKGKDLLEGEQGRDRLLAHQGNDVLIGGTGNDILIGGPGRDTFVYESLGDGRDIIKNFELTKDLLDLGEVFKDEAFAEGSDFRRFINYVDILEINGSTEVRIDVDGRGADTTLITLALIKGRTGLTSANFVLS